MLPDHTTKQCSKCRKRKPRTVEYFPIRQQSKDGFYGWCRECRTEIHRKWRIEHAEQRRQTARKWRAKNPEKSRRQSAEYRRNNPEQRRLQEQRREAKKRCLPATLTPQEWEDIKAAYNYSCAYCGKAWYEIDGVLTQDHVIPVDQGGGYTADNIVPACRSCNSHKNNRTPEQAGMSLRPITNKRK